MFASFDLFQSQGSRERVLPKKGYWKLRERDAK